MMLKITARVRYVLLIESIIMILVALYMAFIYAPAASDFGWSAPKAQKIFYFHVASAWVSYLAFFVVFASSIIYLKSGSRKWDMLALSSAEIGVLFCTLAILTGPIWAKAEWDEYWRWEDLKLFMTLVLWLLYLAYIALRAGITAGDPGRAGRLAAVFGILGFFCVPLSFAANRIWDQYHPTVVATEQGSIQPMMLYALIFAVIAFTLFYFYLLIQRYELERSSIRLEELKERLGGDEYE